MTKSKKEKPKHKFCKWGKKWIDHTIYLTMCGEEVDVGVIPAPYIGGFNYCPYCGLNMEAFDD